MSFLMSRRAEPKGQSSDDRYAKKPSRDSREPERYAGEPSRRLREPQGRDSSMIAECRQRERSVKKVYERARADYEEAMQDTYKACGGGRANRRGASGHGIQEESGRSGRDDKRGPGGERRERRDERSIGRHGGPAY